MIAETILQELSSLGEENYKRLLMRNHGVREPFFGVPIRELQKIRKRVGEDYRLSMGLYGTGNYDAMYLAGLIAEPGKMSYEDFRMWIEGAYGGSLYGSTVPGVAAESSMGETLAAEWESSAEPLVASAGWATWSSIVSIRPDHLLDLESLHSKIRSIPDIIEAAPDRVRYQMNNYIIAVGCYVMSLTEECLKSADALGKVTADLGPNNCTIPSAREYIQKVQARGTIGKKRKSTRC